MSAKYTRDMWALAVKRGDTDDSYKVWVDMMREAASKNPIRPKLSPRELGTILAALRWWQQSMADVDTIHSGFFDIATDNGTFDYMQLQEIEELCQDLNNCEPDVVLAWLYKHANGKIATVSTQTPSSTTKLEMIPLVAQ